MENLREKRNSFEEACRDIKVGIRKKITRVTCPCCGFPTLEERGNYDICELCNWEDDVEDDKNSSKVWGGPNGKYSLDQARENFLEYKIMYSPGNNTTITGKDSAEREGLKTDLISVFNKMLTASKDSLPSLWKQALKIEKGLYKELCRSIKEYEKSIKP